VLKAHVGAPCAVYLGATVPLRRPNQALPHQVPPPPPGTHPPTCVLVASSSLCSDSWARAVASSWVCAAMTASSCSRRIARAAAFSAFSFSTSCMGGLEARKGHQAQVRYHRQGQGAG
jgi:hypothetical protein